MFPPPTLIFDVLGGQSNQHTDRLRQDQKLVEMVTASNVIQDPPGKLRTRDGFTAVRATAITGAPSITGMFHLGDLTDKFIIGTSDGGLYQDSANPPAALVGGTAFTTGANTLLRGDVGGTTTGAGVLVVVSNARDVPQQVSSTPTRTNLAGTPPRGIDFKWFGRRPWMFSPSDGTTIYYDFAVFGSLDDSVSTWSNPYTTNFLNFGRPSSRDAVLGGEIFQDHLLVFTPDHIYRVYQTPNASLPFAYQDPVFSEPGGGPPNIHGVVKADGKIWWISRNFDVKRYDGISVQSVGFAIQPYLRGLSDSRRQYTIGGWEPQFRNVWWAVSNGSNTQHKDVISLNVDTLQFTFLTLQRNAFANRVVGGQLRLIGGDYAGLFYNEEVTTATTGDLQNAASAIDAKITTPKHHLGLPGVQKKIPYVMMEFDPIVTESVSARYALDDTQTFTDFTESPLVMSGTDTKRAFFHLDAIFERIQLQVEDAISGEQFRWLRYGFPKPRIIRASLN